MTLFALSSILNVWNVQFVAYDGAEPVEHSVQPTTNVKMTDLSDFVCLVMYC